MFLLDAISTLRLAHRQENSQESYETNKLGVRRMVMLQDLNSLIQTAGKCGGTTMLLEVFKVLDECQYVDKKGLHMCMRQGLDCLLDQ